MWATMTNETIEYAGPNRAVVSLSRFCEPRIEPEIVIGLNKTPPRQPSLEDIAACVGWIAPGFEIVDFIFQKTGLKPPTSVGKDPTVRRRRSKPLNPSTLVGGGSVRKRCKYSIAQYRS